MSERRLGTSSSSSSRGGGGNTSSIQHDQEKGPSAAFGRKKRAKPRRHKNRDVWQKKSSRGKPGFQPRPSNTQTSARKAGFLLRFFFILPFFFFSFPSLSPLCVLRACACVRGWYTVDESRLPAKKETNRRWSDQWLPGNGLRSRPSGLDLGSAGEVSCKDASILGKREQETSAEQSPQRV